jgi:hypothetical protein
MHGYLLEMHGSPLEMHRFLIEMNEFRADLNEFAHATKSASAHAHPLYYYICKGIALREKYWWGAGFLPVAMNISVSGLPT